jgi:hypothetical protein
MDDAKIASGSISASMVGERGVLLLFRAGTGFYSYLPMDEGHALLPREVHSHWLFEDLICCWLKGFNQ